MACPGATTAIPVSEPGSKETSTRRVGVSPGYPPVGAAHCALRAHPPPASRNVRTVPTLRGKPERLPA
ncbi:MAG: hypothetical protein LBR60_08025, partial [Fibrobacter sp.]|nr:hypothetical protein [Fibrobacter sp.]